MPCDTQALTATQAAAQVTALQRLNAALAAGTVAVRIGAQGGLAFTGWQDRAGLSDLCAYRRLTASNSQALRRALARAEVTAGRKLDPQALSRGVHSHDGGKTWGTHSH